MLSAIKIIAKVLASKIINEQKFCSKIMFTTCDRTVTCACFSCLTSPSSIEANTSLQASLLLAKDGKMKSSSEMFIAIKDNVIVWMSEICSCETSMLVWEIAAIIITKSSISQIGKYSSPLIFCLSTFFNKNIVTNERQFDYE